MRKLERAGGPRAADPLQSAAAAQYQHHGRTGPEHSIEPFPILFNIDGQFVSPINGLGGGRIEVMNGKLPKTPAGKDRVGFMTVFVQGDLRLTQTIEPAAPPSRRARGRNGSSIPS